MSDQRSRGRWRGWLEARIDVGNVLTAITLIIAGTAVVITTRADVAAIARDNRRHETAIGAARARGVDNTIKLNRIETEVTTNLRAIRHKLEQNEKKFDRLERKVDDILRNKG